MQYRGADTDNSDLTLHMPASFLEVLEGLAQAF